MKASFGLTLANRAVVLGAIRARDLIDLTVAAEEAGAFDTVWVGDSLLAKPRLEAVTLLSALASATSRVRLGVGCMATFVHRHPVMLAHQWASLDVLSGGRSLARGVPGRARTRRAPPRPWSTRPWASRPASAWLDWRKASSILRKLFGEKKASHQGRFYQFEGVTHRAAARRSSRAPSGSPATRPGSPGRAGRAPATPWWSGASAAWRATPTAG